MVGPGGECAAEGEARSRILPRPLQDGSDSFLVGGFGDDAGLLLVLEPVALALDVDRRRVVQQTIEDRRCITLSAKIVLPVAIRSG